MAITAANLRPFISELWLDAGDPCLSLADPSRFVAQLRMSTRIAIIAGSTTGSITELVGIEEHALLIFSEHLLDAGGPYPCLGFSNLTCAVAKLRMSTRIAIIAGSTTGSITESLGAEENALLFKD